MINFDDNQMVFLSNTVNASKLIRELLDSHIKSQQPETLEQKQKRLEELKAKAEYEQRLKTINEQHGHITRN